MQTVAVDLLGEPAADEPVPLLPQGDERLALDPWTRSLPPLTPASNAAGHLRPRRRLRFFGVTLAHGELYCWVRRSSGVDHDRTQSLLSGGGVCL